VAISDTLRHELRLACRHLWQGRGGAAAAILTLMLGIAASTAMFALVDGVLLRPLPVRDQAGLMIVWREPRASGTHVPFTAPEVDALSRGTRTLAGAAGVNWQGAGPITVVERGSATALRMVHVTGTFFEVLGTTPVLGRALQPADDAAGAPRALVISHGAWQRRYGGAADAIGRRLFINQQPFVIVGVAPPGLDYPRGTEGWTTVAAMASAAPNQTFKEAVANELDVIARLRDGAAPAQADQELRAILPVIGQPLAGQPAELRPVLRPFEDAVLGDVRPTVLALFGAVVLVLVLACANVATLLLMRGEARVPELAIRAALGASRGRLAGQMLLESFVLALAASAVAIPIARVLLQAVLAWAPPGLPRMDTVAIDARVLLFGAGTALAAAGMAALVPMLAIVRGRLAARVAAHGRATADAAARTGRRVLVSGQLALAVMVVAVTGLLTQSLLRLQAIDAGLDVDRVVLASLAVPQAISSDRDRHLRLLDAVVTRLRAAPSIAAATPINARPFSGVGWSVPAFVAEGQDPARAAANPPLDLEAVHPGYFDTFGVGLLRGRAFAAADRDGALPVTIVSEDVAARAWPGENPLGRRLKMGTAATKGDWLTVVGVARTTRYRELAAQRPVLYVPAEQLIVAAQSIAVRSSAPLADTASAIRAAVRAADPAVQVTDVLPLEELRQAPMARPRFTASLIGTFAVAALFLSAVGVFSVTAASVYQRRHELRVRLALGATPGNLQRLVLGEGLRLALAGIAIGTAGAIAAAQSLRELLYEVAPVDPPSLAGAAALLLVSSLLACALPAWRAARVDPLAALREE